MANTRGGLVLPSPTRTSDLINDSNYLSIREYSLSRSVLSGGTPVVIDDITIGTVITRVEIDVTTAFVSSATQNNISVEDESGEVLMDSDWNDPNTAGRYVCTCYHEVTGDLHIVHDLAAASAGGATLRLYLYDTDV